MTLFMKGDKVQFGRKNGEQTLGIVEKVNGKSLKVRTLESRGRDGRSIAGVVWRVAPSLATLVERGGKPATNADRFPNTPIKPSSMLTGDDALVASALTKLTSHEIRALQSHFRRGYISIDRF